MGYRKITNFQIGHPLLLFKEVFSLEKIHGSSSHISLALNDKGLWEAKVSAGGIKHNDFILMLNTKYKFSTKVMDKITVITAGKDIKTIGLYGEGYGGRCQNMADVYGPLNFIIFEVVKDGRWCGVEEAAFFANQIGMPFVYFEKGPATLEWLDSQKNRPSEQAKRNGMGDNQISEGIVIRPPMELHDDNDGRLIAKHRKEIFRETKSARSLTEEEVEALQDAKEIAEEWVVDHRLTHVLSALVAKGHTQLSMKDTLLVIETMQEDVRVEAGDQIAWSEAAGKAIGRKTAELFKKRVKEGTTNPIEGANA